MSNSTPLTPPADEQASGMGANEHLDEFIEWDYVPYWDPKKQRIALWLEKITVRDLVERVPEVGSEEAVDATAEALLELMDFWPTLEGMTKGRGIWLTSVPPLLREFLCIDFSPRYPEMLEAMRRLRLSVKMSTGGWVAAEERIGDHLWEQRMAEIRIRQRHHLKRHRKDPRPDVKDKLTRRLYAFDNWRYGYPRTSGSVIEWSRSPASRGLSPSEADRLESHLTRLWEELDEAWRRRLSVPTCSEPFEPGYPRYEEYSNFRSQERQIERTIEKLVAGTSEDFSEYERGLGRHR